MNHFAKLLIAACAVANLPEAAAETFNLAQDWSATSNPNGPWSYRRGTTLLPYQATTCCGLPQGPSFAPSSVPGSFLPIFFRPAAAGSDIAIHSYDPGNGGVFLGEAILNWASPITGIVNLSGYFYYAQNPQQRSNEVVVRQGTSVLGQATVSFASFQNSANPWNFSFPSLAVSVGDVLSVSFTRSIGQSAGSSVAGNVVVSAVPEVPSMVSMLLGLGLLGVIASVRKQSHTNDA